MGIARLTRTARLVRRARPSRPLALFLVSLGTACAQHGAASRRPFPPLPGASAARIETPAFPIADDAGRIDSNEAAPRAPLARPALEQAPLGLYAGKDFRVATGRCRDCAAPAAALWYFRNEVVAVPRRAAGTARYPAVVWLGAPEVIAHARLAEDGSALLRDGRATPLAIVPPIPGNSAYVDAATVRFFAARPVRARGASSVENGQATFVARTLWPEDARIDLAGLEPKPLARNELLATLVEAEWGGAAPERFPARLLFERAGDAPRDWPGKAVIALVLSGAQGDDDGARAGHLAIATGTVGALGEWQDWLVDDFYPLDRPNPKGIVAAAVPMDDYLFDLNSGQLYYRPAYMLVAVLSRPRLASAVQGSLQRSMLGYYCGRERFDLARHNSTAFSIDPLRALGWRLPTTGATSGLAALIAAPLAALSRRRLSAGEELYAALTEEKTRLLPRVAFEVLGHDLLYLANGGGRAPDAPEPTAFERSLVEDLDAVLFVRLPQVPSARRRGSYPERSLLVYGARLLTDPGPYERPARPPRGERPPPDLAASCAASPAPSGSFDSSPHSPTR